MEKYKPVYAHVENYFGKVGTICIIRDNGIAKVGASFCSQDDQPQFNKRIGRKYALENAVENRIKYIPPTCRNDFDDTLDYLMGVAKKKLFDIEDLEVETEAEPTFEIFALGIEDK